MIPSLSVRSDSTAARLQPVATAALVTVDSHHPQRRHLRWRKPQMSRDYRSNQNAITTHNISQGGLFTCAAAAKS